jgi:hypothetical protein
MVRMCRYRHAQSVSDAAWTTHNLK